MDEKRYAYLVSKHMTTQLIFNKINHKQEEKNELKQKLF